MPNRGAVEVSGRDTVKLLQGLVSNDVKALASATEPHAPALVYAGFMNPQGRMLADVFIHRQAPLQDGSPRWLLDIDSRTLPSLLAFIKKFKLRSKVKLADVSDEYSVVQAWSSAASPPSSTLTEQLSLDPRCPTIGYRGVVSHEAVTKLREQIASVEDEEYTIHRMLQGVAEGALDVPEAASLPLENNLDYMHGVDFRKAAMWGRSSPHVPTTPVSSANASCRFNSTSPARLLRTHSMLTAQLNSSCPPTSPRSVQSQ